ncbi:hypothetical protein OH76DRAFT_1413105 [Lentinus brumalis]|uniref:Uncharacterized protein n=1 Tax=Lentinus brumalis TaxID=2498619 RepID=A0A371CIW2_9APHY|nr:hypothetical protein OH76DRAFT_1413105 [Polyporus brumalis]
MSCRHAVSSALHALAALSARSRALEYGLQCESRQRVKSAAVQPVSSRRRPECGTSSRCVEFRLKKPRESDQRERGGGGKRQRRR